MGLSWNVPDIIVGLIAFLLTVFGTIAIVAYVLVRLPADYFAPGVAPPFMFGWPQPLRWIGLLAKNALGVLVIAIGVHTLIDRQDKEIAGFTQAPAIEQCLQIAQHSRMAVRVGDDSIDKVRAGKM
jgi:hypothetical protein